MVEPANHHPHHENLDIDDLENVHETDKNIDIPKVHVKDN